MEGSNWSGDGCGVRCDFLEFRAEGGSQVFVVDFWGHRGFEGEVLVDL